jgi:hypothetical protein
MINGSWPEAMVDPGGGERIVEDVQLRPFKIFRESAAEAGLVVPPSRKCNVV